MSAAAARIGLDFISSNGDIRHPPAAKIPRKAPSVQELDAINLPTYGLTGARTSTISDENASTKTPDELEHSQPPTPGPMESAGIVPTFSYPKLNRWRVLAACGEYFGNGLNDSAPGPLIPYIEQSYGIGYAVVSTIWISNAVGFILAAFLTDFLCTRLGRAKCLMLSEICIIASYTIIACPVPFPVVVVMYMAIGFGEALEIALNNVFIANLANSTVLLGAAHGSYGIGGILGPIMATALVSSGMPWSRFYAIAIAFRVINFVAVGWSFWGYEKEVFSQLSNSLEHITSRQSAGQEGKLKAIKRALKYRTTLIGAMFIFFYQGAEVSEAGWIVTYLIQYRDGNPRKVGYIASGFWGGITLGRFVLTHLSGRVGEKKFVFGLTVGCLAFQFLVWFVPNIVGEAVAVAIVGLLIGPVYPCAQTVFARLLPRELQIFAIGFVSSMGSSGGAFVPFITGLIAQAAGTFVLHPICIFCFLWMLLGWACLPPLTKRRE